MSFEAKISLIHMAIEIGNAKSFIFQAWIEASTKGSVLLLTSTEVEYLSKNSLRLSPTTAGILGGVCGGAAQAYLTMGNRLNIYRLNRLIF